MLKLIYRQHKVYKIKKQKNKESKLLLVNNKVIDYNKNNKIKIMLT